MADISDKLQWHPAFYAAAQWELRENREQLEFTAEYNLSREPIRIDLLIVKNADRKPIKNEIGHIMRRYNIIEYKSPKDGLTIDDFYKTIGYACLYKGYGEKVDEIPGSEITVSIFRHSYPRELMQALKRAGFELREEFPGIYYVNGMNLMPVQIVVTGRLEGNHSSLRILTANAKREDVEAFLMEALRASTPGDCSNIDAVLQVSGNANYHLYEEIRRESEMCEVMEKLMADVLEEKYQAGIDYGKTEGKKEGTSEGRMDANLNALRRMMSALKMTAVQAMDVLQIPETERMRYLSKL